jgi:two-component system alkaline phosphatase synthesis response regulator PhoP
MTRTHILIVDDEEDIRELITYNLQKEGFEVTAVESGEQALSEVKNHAPHLVILDLMLPGMDGLEICRLMKSSSRTAGIPIVMLTAKGEEADVVTGLEVGADDYVTKPFSPRVLIARIKAVLRRRRQSVPADDEMIAAGELTLHPGTREVTVNGKPVALSNAEFRILHRLAQRQGWVFTRHQIADSLQSDNAPVTSRTVDVHVCSLRRKLGQCGTYIETVHGVGYRFKDLSRE